MFLPFLQGPTDETYLIVRWSRDPGQLAAALDKTLHALDAEMPLTIEAWDRELASALLPSRAATIGLGALGMMGALLAVTGVFGMASYSVSKRLRDLGICIALGASRKQTLVAALGRAIRLLAYGSIIGLALGLGSTKLLSAIVYGANSQDPLVLGGVLLFTTLLGVVATWIPAQHTLSANPLRLLREE